MKEQIKQIIKDSHILVEGQCDTDVFVVVPLNELAERLDKAIDEFKHDDMEIFKTKDGKYNFTKRFYATDDITELLAPLKEVWEKYKNRLDLGDDEVVDKVNAICELAERLNW